MRPRDDDGMEMNAGFTVVADGSHLSLVLESAGGRGGSADGGPSRNHQYVPALRLLLRRLGDRHAVLLAALVASAHAARLPESERTVLRGPVELAGVADFDRLRLDITTPQGRIGRSPGVVKEGNNRKRLQLRLDVPGYGPGDAARLATDLATPSGSGTPQLPAAAELLRSLIGDEIRTVTGHPNMVVAVDGDTALVATAGSPSGERVAVSEVQNGLDKLQAQGAVRASVAGLGYRSAFVGAVLATLPGAQVSLHPATIRLSSSAAVQGASDPVFGVLDGVAAVNVRKEQAALRNLLAGNRQQAPCALCSDEYPMGFLVAAHVKKRALCSDDERRDLHHVAMLACVFGCDALYEAGWITVGGDGRVQTVPLASAPEGQVRQRLAGRQCLAHSPASAGYFTWHRTTVFRDRIPGRLDTDPPAAR